MKGFVQQALNAIQKACVKYQVKYTQKIAFYVLYKGFNNYFRDWRQC